MRRFLLIAALMSCSSEAIGQLAKEDFVKGAQAAVSQAHASGEPKDRCAIGVQVGDGGRVLAVVGDNPLVVGDTIQNIDGFPTTGLTPAQFIARLQPIGPSATITAKVLHGGIASERTLKCTNARIRSAPVFAAWEAAA